MKLSLKHTTTAFLAAGLLLASNALFAQEVSVGNGQGQASNTVTIEWGYTQGSDAAGIEWCLEWDASVVDLTDETNCVADAPAGFDGAFTSCNFGTATCPSGLNIAVNANDFESVIPTTQPMGSVVFTIDGSATAGDTAALTATCIDVASGNSDPTVLDCTDMTTTDGEIEVVDLTAVLNVQPTSINFPDTENGSSSAAQTITISNDGSDSIDMEVTDVSPATGTHFSVSPNSCAATPFTLSDGQSCTYDAVFEPQAIGNFSDTVTVTSDAGQVTNDQVDLSGEGTSGPAATLAVSPASNDYGQVLTGESETFSFTVSNTGESGSNLELDAIALGGGTDFSISGGTCSVGTNLADGESCGVDVTFSPAADGVQNDTLTVDGTDTVNSTSQQDTATVEGEGVTEARFSSTPAPGGVNMGVTAPGGTLGLTVTVSNSGNTDLTVGSCTETDPNDLFTFTPAAGSISMSIAPDGSDSFDVSCSVPEPGTFTASLSCDTNDADNATVTYDFTCNGQVLEVPTMQNWGLILLTLMMLMVGGLSVRYFRV